MKKNKKYWKKEAKGWKEIALIETEAANNFALENFNLRKDLAKFENKKDYKNPVITWTQTPWAKFTPKSCNCNCNCKK